MVHGTEGSIEVGWRETRVRLHRRGAAAADGGLLRQARVARRHDERVRRASRAGTRRPWITPGECLRTVAAVEAAYRSLRSGGWVSVGHDGRVPMRAGAG